MQIVYYGEEMPYKFSKSLFLAGPSLRTGQEGESWRKDAIQILQDIGFDGVIFVPENRKGRLDEGHNYKETVSWEQKHLEVSDCILFWIPRSEELPGYTTNIEWGKYYSSGKVVLGYPEDALKMKYLELCAKQNYIETADTLTETIDKAIKHIGEGAERVNGERYIPIHIWRLSTFQNWHKSVIEAGNRLEESKTLLFHKNVKKPSASLWIVKPSVYIAKEDRFKVNEIVFGRPDLSSVCMWKRTDDDDFEIVLVKEFRTAGTTEDGFIWELPSGGFLTETPMTHEENAAQEVKEETGFDIDEKKLKFRGARQLAGTMMSHKSHLFSYELDDDELKWFKAQKGIKHGLIKEGEITYIEVVKFSEIKAQSLLDWTNIGEIYASTDGQ